jgi:hypothetical protein
MSVSTETRSIDRGMQGPVAGSARVRRGGRIAFALGLGAVLIAMALAAYAILGASAATAPSSTLRFAGVPHQVAPLQ